MRLSPSPGEVSKLEQSHEERPGKEPCCSATARIRRPRGPVTGRSISFVATPDGSVKHLIQDSIVLSLLISTEQQYRGRAGFCERSLFFWEEQAASSFLASHPEAFLLSIEEAAYVGKLVAEHRAQGASSGT